MFRDNISGSTEKCLTVGSRIKYIRNSHKMTQKIFAESLGIVQGFLSAIEKGRKLPSATLLIALQHLYRINSKWIHSGQGEIMGYTTAQAENIAAIPLFNELPSYKEDMRQATRIITYINLPDVHADCFAHKYTGDYMYPTIRDGDIIIVKPEETLTPGNICLIVGKWGEPLLRRYREINGEQIFSADNSSYSPFHLDSSTRILGIVSKVWREIKI